MKSTGMVRKIDELGRIVVPIELRRSLAIDSGDSVEIYVDEEKIILRKYIPSMTCIVTGENSDSNIRLAGGKIVVAPEVAEELLEELEKTRRNNKRYAAR
jgi:AbrB family transcriptional regulator, transcriptional pleiotropic regulator of transition state genes